MRSPLLEVFEAYTVNRSRSRVVVRDAGKRAEAERAAYSLWAETAVPVEVRSPDGTVLAVVDGAW